MKLLVSLIHNGFLLILLPWKEHTIAATSSSDRNGRSSIFSFKPLGSDVDMGLDFEMPFIQVPMKNNKDKNGISTVTVNINTASLITTGLMAGSSMIVAQLIRSLSAFDGRSDDDDEETQRKGTDSREMGTKIFKETRRRTKTVEKRLHDGENDLYDFKNIFDNFKLVYKNGTSKRVETTLPNIFARIEETFLDNQIDIIPCVQKSICLMLTESRKSVRQGKASSIQEIIDGISSFRWLLDLLARYEELKGAIDASKMETDTNCVLAYPTCKWSAPETQLLELLRTHINFI